jgi:ankyrin repeat protein
MNRPPPSPEPPDELDAAYREAAGAGAPSEPVRRAILDHAAQLAGRRRPAPSVSGTGRRVARRWRPAAFGGLAAAALAGLVLAPRFLTPTSVPTSAQREAADATEALPANALAPGAGLSAPQAEMPAPVPAAPTMPTMPALPPLSAATQTNRAASPAAKSQAYTSGAALAHDSADARTTTSAPVTIDSAPALRQAAESGDLPRLQALLAEQIDLEARDSGGRTALLLAVLHDQAPAVDALLAAGADPNAVDADGTTPLQAAQAGHQASIAAALRRAGAR